MVAEETRTTVKAEQAKASEKSRVAQEIADEAQKDLDEALPALDAALTSLKSLNRNDVVEVRDFDSTMMLKILLKCDCVVSICVEYNL